MHATVFLGSGGFGRESLRRLGEHPDVELVGVVTAPPRPAGRAQQLDRDARSTTPPTTSASRPILTPDRLRDRRRDRRRPGARRRPRSSSPTTARSCRRRCSTCPHGALNLHPSLLPRHRGATPDPGRDPRRRRRDRRDPDADGRRPRHRARSSRQARWALDGDETTPELEERLAARGRRPPRRGSSGRGSRRPRRRRRSRRRAPR